MNFTRRGLFKTIAGAFVASKAVPLLPAAPPPIAEPVFDALNTSTFNALDSSALLYSYKSMFVTFKSFGPVTFDGVDKLTQPLIYEYCPPLYVKNPRTCVVLKNIG